MEVFYSISELTTVVATSASLVLEPNCLSQVYEGQPDRRDRKMAKLVALAQDSNAMYSVWSGHKLELEYRHPNRMQISLLFQNHMDHALPYYTSFAVVLWQAIWVYTRLC